jgi:isochorismate synthase EntC
MVNTRNRNINAENNNAAKNNVENNNAANLPPTLEQVLMMQAQMFQIMQQTMVNMQNAQPQAPHPPPRDRLGDFQRTKLSTFSHFVEPMDADDWLKTVEKKLQVVQRNNREKVLLASHQLIGHAADWWDAYVEAHEEPDTINWNEFKRAF